MAFPDAQYTAGIAPKDHSRLSIAGFLSYLLLGMAFGIILTKSEVISWYRIQEMFRFQSFHMYGIIGTAIGVAALSLQAIKRLGITTLDGEPITIPPKNLGKGYRYGIGGILFGLGWGLLGACPGPMFALLGGGYSILLAGIASAVAGTWAYGYFRSSLPH